LTAELNIVGAGGSLTPFTPTTTFRGTPVTFQGYINAITANAPACFNIGQTVTVRMTAWETAKGSYAAAKDTGYSGFSNDISVTLGGGTTTPPNLLGLQGFTVTGVPEPTTLALGAIGFGALMIRRRK
jgi:hypothetical protein